MARPRVEDDEEKPLDPAVENVRRKLVRFVAINLGLLFVALMAVVIAIVYKSRSREAEAPPAVSDVAVPSEVDAIAGDIGLPAGAKLVSQSLDGNRLALTVQLADGSAAIFIYDIAKSRMIGHFAIKTQ